MSTIKIVVVVAPLSQRKECCQSPKLLHLAYEPHHDLQLQSQWRIRLLQQLLTLTDIATACVQSGLTQQNCVICLLYWQEGSKIANADWLKFSFHYWLARLAVSYAVRWRLHSKKTNRNMGEYNTFWSIFFQVQTKASPGKLVFKKTKKNVSVTFPPFRALKCVFCM